MGEKNANGGNYALKSLEKATADLNDKKIDVLVTAPINKDNNKLLQKIKFLKAGIDLRLTIFLFINEIFILLEIFFFLLDKIIISNISFFLNLDEFK